MQQFTNRPEGFGELKKALLLKTIPTSLLAGGVGIAISNANTNTSPDDSSAYLGIIPIMLGALAFGLYRGVIIQKKIFNSYTLTFDNESVTREQYNTPTISIPYREVTGIIKNSNNSFTIKGNSAVNVIGIPSQINDYTKLEVLLAEIRLVSVKTTEPFIQKFSPLLSILTLGLMATVYLAKNKVAVGVSGAALLALLGYSFFEVRRSRNIDGKTKKGMWWLLLVIASILAVTYIKLTR
jgi:hypothetical protein